MASPPSIPPEAAPPTSEESDWALVEPLELRPGGTFTFSGHCPDGYENGHASLFPNNGVDFWATGFRAELDAGGHFRETATVPPDIPQVNPWSVSVSCGVSDTSYLLPNGRFDVTLVFDELPSTTPTPASTTADPLGAGSKPVVVTEGSLPSTGLGVPVALGVAAVVVVVGVAALKYFRRRNIAPGADRRG